MSPFEQSVAFIRSIGIPVTFCTLPGDTFLPGLLIDKGSIRVDPEQLKHPGDILHEAGHVAVVAPQDRALLSGDSIGSRAHRAAEEMMAIAWSYAACKHLDIDPSFVFHDEGYQGGGSNLAEQFAAGSILGVPMLQWAGMSAEPRQAKVLGREPYPAMTCWMRPE